MRLRKGTAANVAPRLQLHELLLYLRNKTQGGFVIDDICMFSNNKLYLLVTSLVFILAFYPVSAKIRYEKMLEINAEWVFANEDIEFNSYYGIQVANGLRFNKYIFLGAVIGIGVGDYPTTYSSEKPPVLVPLAARLVFNITSKPLPFYFIADAGCTYNFKPGLTNYEKILPYYCLGGGIDFMTWHKIIPYVTFSYAYRSVPIKHTTSSSGYPNYSWDIYGGTYSDMLSIGVGFKF